MNITLIGCGQMGSRHLQAVTKLEGVSKIDIVEPSKQARDLGISRIEEIKREFYSNGYPTIEFFSELSALPNTIPELTIIATKAGGREKIIKSLLQKGHKRFLIEKMVCQSKKDYLDIINSLQKSGAKGWVNCPRRYFPFYNKISARLKKESPLIMTVVAGNLGLGCNAIHFLDLFILLTEEPNLKISGDYLWPELYSNPRGEDLVEFAGTLTACTPRGGFASITFHPANNAPPVIDVLTETSRVWVDEWGQRALIAEKQNGWKWENSEFQNIYTSALTTIIARSILKNDDCMLPTVKDLYSAHCELFRNFESHATKLTGKKFSYCPIT